MSSEERELVANIDEWAKFLRDEPCDICGGIEGCYHPVPERARARLKALKRTSNLRISQ